MTDILKQLAAPFPAAQISWRVGSTTADKRKGMALAYIDARDVQDRLDAVCGVFWQVRTPWSANGKLACEIGIKIGDEWVWRGDGAGDSDVEADKGAFSDAFKRAAVRWGIGRYLYDMDSPWVELEPAGKSFRIATHEHARLRKVLEGKAAPAITPRAPSQVAPAKVEYPAPPSHAMSVSAGEALKAEAEAFAARLKAADTLFALDAAMDEGRALLQRLPQATYDYLGRLYLKRHDAMVTPA